jgi:hypothetical protein
MPVCPKCGFAVGEGFTECPSCGVILAKVRATAPPRLPPDLQPPPPPPEAVSPYAPPAAALQAAPPPQLYTGPPPVAATGEEISPRTLEALVALRPWLRFLVIYGFVALAFMGLGAAGMLMTGLSNPKMLPLAAVYGFYALIGLVFLLPLNRSVQAIRRLAENGPRMTLETFVSEQGIFWRRAGVMTVIMLCLVLLGLVLALFFGGMAAMMR